MTDLLFPLLFPLPFHDGVGEDPLVSMMMGGGGLREARARARLQGGRAVGNRKEERNKN